MTRYQREALARMVGYTGLFVVNIVMMAAHGHSWTAAVFGALAVFCAWRFEKARATFIGDESP